MRVPYEDDVRDAVEAYTDKLREISQESEDITDELSFRPSLQELFDNLKDIPEYAFSITIHEPSRHEFGAPDFKLKRGYHIIGYADTKPLGSNLDDIVKSEQIQRYISAVPNFILTDYLTFVLFQEGQERLRAKVLNLSQLETRDAPAKRDVEDLIALYDVFFQYQMPAVRTPEQLAKVLAKRCNLLNRAVLERLKIEEGSPAIFQGLYETYREFLMRDLEKEDFANLYAQSTTYGLLMASLKCQDEHFTKEAILRDLPPSVDVIKALFRTTTAYRGELPEEVEWIIDDIISLLDASELSISDVLASASPLEFIKDPLIFFYEAFLAEYNPKERGRRGVYYTPDPIVEFIIRAVDYFLITKFNKEKGLLSDNVTLLDPALGTGTFLAHAIRILYNKLEENNTGGMFPDVVNEKILHNFIGLELLPAPHIIAHLKFSRLLEELGYELPSNARPRIYLTNTLMSQDVTQSAIPFTRALASEAVSAEKVKKEEPILAIVGNPPYSGHSYNKGKEIQKLVDEYKKIEGESIGERNPKWLNDDYVKFIRWTEWKIAESDTGNKRGIIGLITNNAYIDNPTFRGMRKHLLDTFSEIYLINLHGNLRLREEAPEGTKDENVFQIRPGVSILFLIKEENSTETKVFYIDKWGKKEEKYRFLLEEKIEDLDFIEIEPTAPYYLFKKVEDTLGARLSPKVPSIKELMPLNSIGIATHRDHFAVSFNKEELEERIRDFSNPSISKEKLEEKYDLKNTGTWKLEDKRSNLFTHIPEGDFKEYQYRPFDKRWIFYNDAIVDRRRHKTLKDVYKIENMALILGRSGRATPGKWDLAYITSDISDINVFYRGGGTVFPLYYKPTNDVKNNVDERVIENLSEKYGSKITPKEILYYIYGVLNSPSYREIFAQELDNDFPKIPFPYSHENFKKMVKFGEKITELHLLNEGVIGEQDISYPVRGNHKVEKRKYSEDEGRVYINDEEYFGNITLEMWEYTIGAYSVLDKWLKEREDKILSMAEIETFRKIAMAIKKTLSIYPKIDEVFEEIVNEVYNPISTKESSLKDFQR